MELHLEYETVEAWPLEREENPLPASPKFQNREFRGGETLHSTVSPKSDVFQSDLGEVAEGRRGLPRLIARKERGEIEIDSLTTLHGVPPEAWEYRLGTYSALEWVLERYKEKKPKDPTIAEKFNTYRFAEYKESVIELLGKVC